jgi:hypothetical protein
MLPAAKARRPSMPASRPPEDGVTPSFVRRLSVLRLGLLFGLPLTGAGLALGLDLLHLVSTGTTTRVPAPFCSSSLPPSR